VPSVCNVVHYSFSVFPYWIHVFRPNCPSSGCTPVRLLWLRILLLTAMRFFAWSSAKSENIYNRTVMADCIKYKYEMEVIT
jgi:hypothetical protein